VPQLSRTLALHTEALWIDALDLDLWTRELDTGVGIPGDMLSGSRTKLQRQVASLRLPRGSELLFRDVALTIVSTRRTKSLPLGIANQS
jgi:hypothetical protein